MALDRTWAGGSFYGAFGITHEFSNDVGVEVSSVSTVSFERSSDPTRFEVGFGGNLGIAEGTRLYGSVEMSRGFEFSSDSTDLSATVGVSFRW